LTSATDVAWAAGLFEGEGCISVKRQGGRAYLVIALVTTDLDVMERFHAIVGVGHVNQRPVRGHKMQWQWHAHSADARAVTTLFLPYLGERRLARLRGVIAEVDA
jgi:hypothetical protein